MPQRLILFSPKERFTQARDIAGLMMKKVKFGKVMCRRRLSLQLDVFGF